MALSLIIPILNEEAALSEILPFLNSLENGPDEILVVDGGSVDGSLAVAEDFGAKVISSKVAGRAAQLDLGAKKAANELLCFLHADTFPSTNFKTLIESTLSDDRIALGGFISIMRGKRNRYWISYLNYVKTYFCSFIYSPKRHWNGLRLLFGDQVMFCRKNDYLQSGGFDIKDDVMEEANFCLRMNSLGRVKQVHHFVYSSDRRVAEWGFWKANKIYIGIAMGWALKIPTYKLKSQYEDVR